MKTIKFIFSLLVSLVLVAPAWAAPTDGYVYSKDASAFLGEEFDLPIALKSANNKVKSFQFTITLPDGISFATDGSVYKKKLESAYPGWVVVHKTVTGEPENTSMVSVYYAEDATTCIDKGDNVILYLVLKADENADLSNTKISLSKEVVTLEDGTETVPLAAGESITSTVSQASYAEGYSLEIIPFANTSTKASIPVNYTSAKNLKGFSFDIAFSSATNFVPTKPTMNNDAYSDADWAEFFETAKSSSTMTGNSTDTDWIYINSGSGTLCSLTTAIKMANLQAGVYTVTLSKIKFTDLDGNVIVVAPYTADIYIGENPKATATDGVLAFHGNYSATATYALLTAALPSEVVTTADLTAVTALPASTTFSVGNPNAIILATKDLGISTNVVIDGQCANLVLTDGYPFANTETFTATSASYSRTMTDNTWGTLCLPFAATATNASVYNLTSVGSGEMKYEEASTPTAVSANTPCVIKKSSDEISFSASSVEVPATPETITATTSVSGWTLYGTTVDVNFTSSELGNIYFINGDAFWKASGSLHVAPFRAYFTGTGSSAKLRIEEETNGIEAIEAEAETGVFYDLQGRTVKAPQAGQFYIQGSKKYIVK